MLQNKNIAVLITLLLSASLSSKANSMPLLSADSTSTIPSKEEMSNATKVYDLNGYDILYSSDGKKLLKARVNDWNFSIKNGTETICDGAIKLMASEYLGLFSLNLRIPASVKKIGKGALTQKTILNNIEVDPSNNYFCSIKESRILYPIQIGIIASVLRPDEPNLPIQIDNQLRNYR